MRKRLAVLSGYGIVTAALLAGTTAYVALDKSVTVSVDGKATHVRTFATTVAGALHRAGIVVGEHDRLTPPATSRIGDGATITIARGRLLAVSVDGVRRDVWVTASNVDAALKQIGIRTTGAAVSADRSARVPFSGMSVDVELPHSISVDVDGGTHAIVSTKTTLGAALAEAGILVHPGDSVSIPLSTRPADDMRVVIVRMTSGQVLETSPIPFTSVTKSDPNAYVGTKRVAQQGRNGTLTRTYRLTFADGVQQSKTLAGEQVTQAPVQQIVMVGSKPKPKPKVYAVKADGLNWAALAACESGGRANAYDPPFYGLYQFRLGTWQAVGGKGLPSAASASEQTYRAQLLFSRSNWKTQWPVCGHYLFS